MDYKPESEMYNDGISRRNIRKYHLIVIILGKGNVSLTGYIKTPNVK